MCGSEKTIGKTPISDLQLCLESRTGRLGFVIFLKEMVSYSSQASARQGVPTARVGLLFASKITWKKLKFESAEGIAFQGMIIMFCGIWASQGNTSKTWPAQQ